MISYDLCYSHCSTMRTVCFIKHLYVKLRGKVSQNCIALGDVDNDSCNELLVAMSGGIVQIYKEQSQKPWWELDGLGDIACVSIGDICNQSKNSVVVFTRNGYCFIVDISLNSGSMPTHIVKSTRLIMNIDNVLIGDIDNDGSNELIICHSDPAVTAYRWSEKSSSFNLLQRWKLQNLAGNATLHAGPEGQLPLLMVSQPGCSHAVLKLYDDSKDDEDEGFEDVLYTPLSSISRLQNPDTVCKILGNITKSGEKTSGYFAMCTLDGTLKLIEEDKILWSVQVDHQLFAMDKLDVLGDNREEVIVCAWDGLTYIVDHDRNVVRYPFLDDVQAFHAGKFCIDGKANQPCLVYVDFHNQLCVYYDVKLPFLRSTDLVSVADGDEEMRKCFETRGLTTVEEKGKFLRQCLEGPSTSQSVEEASKEEPNSD